MTRLVFALIAAPLAPAQDALEIVRRSVERDAYNAGRLKNYAFIEREERRFFDKNGKPQSTKSETNEILILGGRPYARKIAENDKPLSEKDSRKEQERLDREAARRQKESAGERAKLAKERAEQRRFLREVPDAFTFRLLGEEQVSGKPAWVIEALPRPAYRPKDSRAKVLAKVRGRLWIEQAEYEWVKAEAEVLQTLSFGLGVVRVAPGGTLRFEQMRMNDEVWVPSSVSVRAQARLAFVKQFRGEFETTYRDYRRFQSESRIVSFEGNSEP
jgi:hypothetical protein